VDHPLIAWTLWTIGAIIAAGAGVLFVWAVFLDRARGRMRCPRCWYTLDATTKARCPECGHVPRSERQLRRTRRRHFWAAVAVVMLAGAYVTAVTPGMLKGGWRRGIPSTVLVTVWPMDLDAWLRVHLEAKTSNDPDIAELDRRIEKEELSSWHHALWVRRLERHLAAQGRLGIERETPVLEAMERARITWDIKTERVDDVLAELSKRIGIPITPDWDSLIAEGIMPQTTVTVRMYHENGAEALVIILRAAGLEPYVGSGWWAGNGEIHAGVPQPGDERSPILVHDARAITEAHPEFWRIDAFNYESTAGRTDVIERILQTYVDPGEWLSGGGTQAASHAVGTFILVRAPVPQQQRIQQLLDVLGQASRREGVAAACDRAEWDATTSAWELLSTRLMPLDGSSRQIDELINAAGTTVIAAPDVDWDGLATANVRPSLQVRTVAAEMTGAQAMDRFVQPLVPDTLSRLSWSIRHGVVRIGRAQDIDTHTVTRSYNIADVVALPDWSLPDMRFGRGGSPPPKPWAVDVISGLRRILQDTVDRESWIDSGGDTGLCTIFGPCLIIQTTPRNHLRIEALLKQLRQGPPKRAFSSPAPADQGEELDEDGDVIPLDAQR
jgi:hypothetical protein